MGGRGDRAPPSLKDACFAIPTGRPCSRRWNRIGDSAFAPVAERRGNIAPQHAEAVVMILIGVWLLSVVIFLLLALRAPTLADDGLRYGPQPTRRPTRLGRF
jgi:hypothetical protein